MDYERFLEYITSSTEAQEFKEMFGGNLAYGFEYGFVYGYGKRLFLLPENFQELVKESIEKNENLLLNLKEVK